MEIPVFEHQPHTGETTTGQGHTQTETIELKDTTMQSNEKPLPAAVQENIEAFQSTKAAFLDWQGKYNDLQAKAKNQTALAEAAEAEAEKHKEALRGVVRDMVRTESGEKEVVNDLAAKQQLAESLAAEHRAFAAELLAEAENLRLHGLIAASDYYKARQKVFISYSDYEFKKILDDIGERILRAIKLKVFHDSASGARNYEGSYIDSAIRAIGVHFKNQLSGHIANKISEEFPTELAQPAGINPFTLREVTDNPTVLKVRQQLRKAQEQGAA